MACPAANFISLSDFEDEIPSSNGNNAQVVHIDAAEDRDIYEYLTTHDAFRHLVSEVQRLVERHFCRPDGARTSLRFA